MEFGLDACGLVLAAKIGACGSIEMGFDACGLVLVAEISACGSTKSMLVGFDSYGACGGELIWLWEKEEEEEEEEEDACGGEVIWHVKGRRRRRGGTKDCFEWDKDKDKDKEIGTKE